MLSRQIGARTANRELPDGMRGPALVGSDAELQARRPRNGVTYRAAARAELEASGTVWPFPVPAHDEAAGALMSGWSDTSIGPSNTIPRPIGSYQITRGYFRGHLQHSTLQPIVLYNYLTAAASTFFFICIN